MKLNQWMKKNWIVAVIVLGVAACGGKAVANGQEPTSEIATSTQAEANNAPSAFDGKPAPGTKAKCLIMGATFTVSEKTEFSTYKGKTYVFCCPGCKPKFDADPEKYIKKG